MAAVAARVRDWAGGALKVATFNVNGVVKRLGNLLDWLAEAEPDVVCLQELKAAEPDFPAQALEAAGYGAVWRGQRAWNGVAILARGAEPVLTRDALPGDEADHQPRYIEAAVRACSSPRSTRRTATRSRGRSSPTSSRGWSGSTRMPPG